MATDSGIGKICIVCGEDCADKPRTKDAKGNYYCQPCYQRTTANKQPTAKPPATRAAATGHAIASPPVVQVDSSIECPTCGAAVYSGSATCTNCGSDMRRPARTAPPPLHLQASTSRSSAAWLKPVLVVAVIAVVLGGIAIGVHFGWKAYSGRTLPASDYSGRRLSFQYPTPWRIQEYPSSPGDADITVHAAGQASIRIICERAPGSIDDLLAASAEDIQVTLANPYYGPTFDSWGSFRGSGKLLEDQEAGDSVTIRIFITKLDANHILRVIERWPNQDERAIRSGFRMISSSLALH